jgi:putative peptide zinc metalloprotease protein
MSRPVHSDSWYRIAALKPQLRSHVRLHRHAYRGAVWYVIEDRLGGKHHRFNFQAYRILDLLDGSRSLDEVWQLLSTQLDDSTPTQDEILRLLSTLHAADLVQVDITPDLAELLERRSKQVRRKWISRLGNPMGLRFPLWDPDALLTRLAQVIRPLQGAWLPALWLALVLPALLIAPAHWAALTATSRDQLLASNNLLMLALLFPLVKVVHELGHGLACKRFGGEVHETGLMLLMFYPVPYVDASHAAAFVSKWQRALVGAAGMLAEFAIAAIAFYAWLLLEPGLARGVAYNVAVLASVTTLFFNGNPLLRFDGYYILADLIEIPNLAARATRHWQYLAERYVFGVRGSEAPAATVGERRWFVFFAPASYAYRLLVALGIALLVANQFYVLGVLMALWTVGQSVCWPAFKALRALWVGPQFAERSLRVRAVLATATILSLLLLSVLPLPHHTLAQGVLWLPERAIVRAQSDGFVRQVLATPGDWLENGVPVLDMVEPALVARIQAQQAKADELQVRLDAAWGQSQAKAQQFEQQLAQEQAALARLQDEARNLTLRTRAAGVFLLESAADLPGRFLKQGDVVGYLRTADAPLVRLVVPQSEVDAVHLDTRHAEVRMAQDSGTRWDATLLRLAPAAVHQLPSAALGPRGGGELATDPRDDKGLTTLDALFEFELRLPQEVPHELLGSRVLVRFEHSPEPVGWRAGRALRRLFLSKFSA